MIQNVLAAKLCHQIEPSNFPFDWYRDMEVLSKTNDLKNQTV